MSHVQELEPIIRVYAPSILFRIKTHSSQKHLEFKTFERHNGHHLRDFHCNSSDHVSLLEGQVCQKKKGIPTVLFIIQLLQACVTPRKTSL